MTLFKRKLLFLWVLFVSFLLSFCQQIFAKWAPVADAPIKSSYTKVIKVNDNGTYELMGEINREILTERGRENAFAAFYYNGANEKIEILEAKTISNGKEYFLDKKLIEDKPLASSPDGFDQYRQILLAFPRAEVGAKLYVKYKFVLKEPLLKDFFARAFYFGEGELNTSDQIKIISKLPLHVLANDPNHVIKINKKKSNGYYDIDIVLTKPTYINIIGEPTTGVLNEKYLTWVSVSSVKNWKELATRYGALWTKVFTQKLPEDFELILKAASKKNSEVEQINTVTSMLRDKVRYMGDWRSIKGKLVPRDLDTISKTQIGDCKDFSAATAAILTKLGYKAQIVAVVRGVDKLSKHTLPSFEAFNHAIVRVTDKKSKIYWVDPTNFESMADGIFPDIAGKDALILDPEHPDYIKIPNINFVKNERHLKRQWEIINDIKFIETGELLLKNENTIGIIGEDLKSSPDRIKSAVFYSLADKKNLDEKDKKYMHLPKLNSRIVNDVFLDYSFERKDQIFSTNAGLAFKLIYSDPISKICDISQDYVSDVFIDYYPYTYTRQTIVKNVDIKNVEFLNKEINTPWIYVKRECHLDGHDLHINETIITYKNLIPNEDIHKSEFLKLRDWLGSNFKTVDIIYTPVKK